MHTNMNFGCAWLLCNQSRWAKKPSFTTSMHTNIGGCRKGTKLLPHIHKRSTESLQWSVWPPQFFWKAQMRSTWAGTPTYALPTMRRCFIKHQLVSEARSYHSIQLNITDIMLGFLAHFSHMKTRPLILSHYTGPFFALEHQDQWSWPAPPQKLYSTSIAATGGKM